MILQRYLAPFLQLVHALLLNGSHRHLQTSEDWTGDALPIPAPLTFPSGEPITSGRLVYKYKSIALLPQRGHTLKCNSCSRAAHGIRAQAEPETSPEITVLFGFSASLHAIPNSLAGSTSPACILCKTHTCASKLCLIILLST